MIYFKKIRWQNFLSTGNQFTEVILDRSQSTLVVGENGAGKSTILDALSFALYNKPFRKINRPQLVNAITQKDAVVELEFTVGGKEYLVRRGIKPAVFEILVNDQLLNQSSNVREYQEILEKNILKMNHKSFSQIIVLGSANFMPFMQLTAQDRREVIEDLLDIQIFSTMNILLKEKISNNKIAITDNDYRIDLAEQKIELHRNHIDALKRNNAAIIAQKLEKIAEYETASANLTKINASFSMDVATLSSLIDDQDKVSGRAAKIIEMEKTLEARIKKLRKDISFFEEHDNCPTCQQGIDEQFKCDTIATRQNKEQEVTEALTKLESEYQKANQRIEEIAEINKQITTYNKQITDNLAAINFNSKHITLIQAEIEQLKETQEENTSGVEELSELNKQLKGYKATKEDLINQREVFDVASYMLKDSGIKTKIIRQYIPIMNKLINKYLAAMDFFCQFELDESFNEKIKSRFRDEFSYASFSEGEKMRIDLAILFAWRAVAKLRNSASTNLLIMDEVFDSSLDAGGTEEFIKILEGLTQDTNTFIISHKGDQLYDKFHSVIKFEKHKNFSRIAT
jgi:DNA repair exonuclease SbcCD ATPase subunit